MSKIFTLQNNKRVYAIGDIHGFPDVLQRMHDAIDADIAARPVEEATVVYLGDYIDRGPDSKGVIDLLIARKNDVSSVNHVFLKGNHEGALLEYLEAPQSARQDWLVWGGVQAMESYDYPASQKYPDNESLINNADKIATEFAAYIPDRHMDFYNALELYHVAGDFLFVHAGIQPSVPLERQSAQDLIFTREPFLSYEEFHDYYVVHGHTIVKDKKADKRANRINLDSGLYNGGPLTCAVIEGADIDLIEIYQ